MANFRKCFQDIWIKELVFKALKNCNLWNRVSQNALDEFNTLTMHEDNNPEREILEEFNFCSILFRLFIAAYINVCIESRRIIKTMAVGYACVQTNSSVPVFMFDSVIL